MNKNIIIGILAMLCTVLLVFGITQSSEAQQQAQLADQQRQVAFVAQQEAIQQQRLAEANAAEAQRQAVIANETVLRAQTALEECEGKSKR